MTDEGPLTLKCARGEEWPLSSFTCYVHSTAEVSVRTIFLVCPLGHEFDLQKARKLEIFTDDQVDRLLEGARDLQKQHGGSKGGNHGTA